MDSTNGLDLPPGFRFHPNDEELVMHYLCRRCAGQRIAASIIAEIDLYKFDPWDLPEMALYGEKEWYFFSPRDRKYTNGSRPNRAAGAGYWKATGADKPIGKPNTLGIKKALVFYAGKAPKGIKTNWIMHEYRLAKESEDILGIMGGAAVADGDEILLLMENQENGSRIVYSYGDDKLVERFRVGNLPNNVKPLDLNAKGPGMFHSLASTSTFDARLSCLHDSSVFYRSINDVLADNSL